MCGVRARCQREEEREGLAQRKCCPDRWLWEESLGLSRPFPSLPLSSGRAGLMHGRVLRNDEGLGPLAASQFKCVFLHPHPLFLFPSLLKLRVFLWGEMPFGARSGLTPRAAAEASRLLLPFLQSPPGCFRLRSSGALEREPGGSVRAARISSSARGNPTRAWAQQAAGPVPTGLGGSPGEALQLLGMDLHKPGEN